jgi:hypothetical protein
MYFRRNSWSISLLLNLNYEKIITVTGNAFMGVLLSYFLLMFSSFFIFESGSLGIVSSYAVLSILSLIGFYFITKSLFKQLEL